LQSILTYYYLQQCPLLSEIKQQIENGKPKAKIAREFGISRMTLYNYLEQSFIQSENTKVENE